MPNIARYRKLIAAVVGMVAARYVPDLLPFQEDIVEIVLMVATALAVYQFPNEPL